MQPAPWAQQAHKVQQVQLAPLAQRVHKARRCYWRHRPSWSQGQAQQVQQVGPQVHKARQELGWFQALILHWPLVHRHRPDLL